MDDLLTTRGLIERIAREQRPTVPLGELLDTFSERAFGLFLLIALLPAFLPLPAGAGAISGPLVSLCGLQLLLLGEHPWLPRWLQRRPVAIASIDRLRSRLATPLGWLERVIRPRRQWMIDHPAPKAFTGLLLIVLGVLLAALSLPLIARSAWLGWRRVEARHRAWARWTWPLWLYGISSAWDPCSLSSPRCNTKIRSTSRIVDKRWAMMMAVRLRRRVSREV